MLRESAGREPHSGLVSGPEQASDVERGGFNALIIGYYRNLDFIKTHHDVFTSQLSNGNIVIIKHNV